MINSSKNQFSRKLVFTLVASLSYCVTASAIDTVIVTAPRPERGDPYYGDRDGPTGGPTDGGGGIPGSPSDIIAVQKKQSKNSDIRCNPELPPAMKSITSRSSEDDRWAVANQLQALWNVKNGPLERINRSLFGFFNSKHNYEFKITYADGGQEWWTVNPAISSISVLQTLNHGLYLQDGVVKPSSECPNYG